MSDTQARIMGIIREHFGDCLVGHADPGQASLVRDCQLDSLDLVELAMSIEDDFGIEITDAEAEPFTDGEGKTVAEWAALVDRKLAPAEAV